jgi:hypothetical protein
MTINHVFIAFMIATGSALGVVLVVAPHVREFRLPPYFWILIAMGLFELVAFARGRGAPGTLVTMDARVAGFVLGILIMIVIPILAGSPGRLL